MMYWYIAGDMHMHAGHDEGRVTESDLAGTAVDLGSDAEFGIIAVTTWMFS